MKSIQDEPTIKTTIKAEIRGRGVWEIDDQVIGEEQQTTRLVCKSKIIGKNTEHPDENLKIELVHQRKTPKGGWTDPPKKALSTLQAGEEVALHLDTKQTRALHSRLMELYKLAEYAKENPNSFGGEYLIIKAKSNIQDSAKGAIRELLKFGHSDEIWEELLRSSSDLATKLADARIQQKRQTALKEFENMLTRAISEPDWQKFFSRETWIFGYGLDYRFLNTLSSESSYGGINYQGKGMQRGDFLASTEAVNKFTVLIEIKKPDTDLFGGKSYRNGAWELSPELVGGISQLQSNCHEWQIEGSQSRSNRELEKMNIHTVLPKGILIIGHTKQFSDNQSKMSTFELFRRNMNNPEVLTFDEVYERARFIVDKGVDTEPFLSKKVVATENEADPDIPF